MKSITSQLNEKAYYAFLEDNFVSLEQAEALVFYEEGWLTCPDCQGV